MSRRLLLALMGLVLLASPAAGQTKAQLDSLRTEAVRSRGFVRGAETQLTKFIDMLDRMMMADSIVIIDPIDTITPPPADTTSEPVVDPAVAFILGDVTGESPWPFFDANLIDTGSRIFGQYLAEQNANSMQLQYYYDLGRVAYMRAHRTGNAEDLRIARAVVEKRIEQVQALTVWDRTAGGIADMTPRGAALSGLFLYLHDVGDVMLHLDSVDVAGTDVDILLSDYLKNWADHHYRTWITRGLGGEALRYGVRDGSYTLLYTAYVAQLHPQDSVRARFREMARAGAVDYYVRLQYTDGGWYWTDSGAKLFPRYDEAGTFVGYYKHSQPFMIGLLTEALAKVDQLLGGEPAIRDAVVRAADWLYTRGYRPNEPVPEPFDTINWRGMWYLVAEPGTRLAAIGDPNVTDMASVECSWPRLGADGVTVVQGSVCLRGGSDFNSIRDVRQLNPTTLNAFGYALEYSGDERFRAMGDEVFAATFGKGEGPGADAAYALCDYDGKSLNQCYRSSYLYLPRRF